MNAHEATLTALATADTGSVVKDPAPNAPAACTFDLVLGAVAGHTLQCVASLVSRSAQIVSIIRSNPFVLV